nr:hypothetical protein 10 [Legionellales bacterium]
MLVQVVKKADAGKYRSWDAFTQSIYSYFGDDDLFDAFHVADDKGGKSPAFAPKIVATHLKKFLKDYEKNPDNFKKPFEPKAIKILTKLVKRYG